MAKSVVAYVYNRSTSTLVRTNLYLHVAALCMRKYMYMYVMCIIYPPEFGRRTGVPFANAVTEHSLSPRTVSCMHLVVVAGPLSCACTRLY